MGPGTECLEEPKRFDYDAYLDFLEEHGHNSIRLWRWKQFRWQAAGGDFQLCMTPQPWARTGPDAPTDGRARFDLTTFDDAFLDRLRRRVAAEGDRGIYVGVMLFEGLGTPLESGADNVKGHPCRSGIRRGTRPGGRRNAATRPHGKLGHRRRQAPRGIMWWSMVVIHTAKSVAVEMASASMNQRLARW